ncbi:Mov34/MPN/PAD-1 family protein [Craurococcus roseus]|uniref:Mov34/MPN/PAD-1 family protein n=1 Tax=Craurococcus roseus TaxID=77585 RepID=A0ABP3PSU8_9PROT
MGPLHGVNIVELPKACVDATERHLRRVGQGGNEGLVLWTGTCEGSTAHVREAVIPKQQGVRTPSGIYVSIDRDEFHRLNVHLYRTRQILVAQVHSHPGRAYHSSMDDEYAVATQVGSLSLVVPDFAARPFSVRECAVYRLSPRRQWVELPRADADRLIRTQG